MNEPDFDPLLTDLVSDSDFNRFRGELKKRALTRFRRCQAWRRVRRMGAAVVLIAVAVLALLRIPERAGRSRLVATAPGFDHQPSAAAAARMTPSTQMTAISDEELLASFPLGSCFLAEVNGETMLVFTDDKVRSEVLR
jgi:hypothetical protein